MYWNKTGLINPVAIFELNSNIRCIEMGNNDAAILASRGWIVTLDVLKSLMELLLLYRIGSWIVTLDVLKSA